MYDLLIVGAGPCGLACAIAAQEAGLSYVVLEKGSLTESIRRYPINMTFFSTAERIEIGDLPFAIPEAKPNRAQALVYYRRVVEKYNLSIQLFAEVVALQTTPNGFLVQTKQGENLEAKKVVWATGYFDKPKLLGIPGEDLPHVSHYYNEPFLYVHQRVVIIGGGNSAIETALDLYRNGVHLTLLVRGENFKPTAKYWLLPDLQRRIAEGHIRVIFQASALEITRNSVIFQQSDEVDKKSIAADFVLALTGYQAATDLLAAAGVPIEATSGVPHYNLQTFETNIQGLYVVGTAICGRHTEKIFIENGRLHGQIIVQHILNQAAQNCPPEFIDED